MKVYVVTMPDGTIKKFKGNSIESVQNALSNKIPDFDMNIGRYDIRPLEGRREDIVKEESYLQKQLEMNPQGYQETENFGEFVADQAFPMASMLARGGADKSTILGATAGEAGLNFIPGAIASKGAATAGLKGGSNLLARGIGEGLLTAGGEYALQRSANQDPNASGILLSGLTSMAPDLFQAGTRKIGQKAYESAPKVLEYSLVPDRATRASVNPPDYRAMLDKGFITPIGGLKGAQENISKELAPLRVERQKAIKYFDANGGKIDLADVEKSAIEILEKARLSPDEMKRAKRTLSRELYSTMDEAGDLNLPASQVEEIRDRIDAKFTDLKEATSERAKEALKMGFNKTLKENVPDYKIPTNKMADLLPMKKVVDNRMQFGQKPMSWLRDMPSAGVAGIGGIVGLASQNPSVAIGGLLGGLGLSGLNRLVGTAGGSAILNSIGKPRGMLNMPIQSMLNPFLIPQARAQQLED